MNGVNPVKNRKASILLLLMACAIIFGIAFSALRWRADQAPDIFTDEIIYTRLGIRMLGEGALVWDSGEPFLVHPPLYFLVESIYLAFTSDRSTPIFAAGDIFASVYNARGLNAIFAGLTAIILFFLGRRFHGNRLGLFLVSLYVLDPFGVRINRRAMLETLTALLTLGGIAALTYEREKTAIDELRRGIQAGLLLGLAMLAKELTFVTLAAVLLFGVWETGHAIQWRRRFSLSLLAPFLAVTIAGVTYAIYPAWMLTTGRWDPFMKEKLLGIQRLLGLVQITGWNRPGLSLVDLLYQRFFDYGSSYFLLALGGIATLFLLIKSRNQRTGRLLGTWGLALYSFFTFTALFGSGNDQFFYLLLVPAIVILGYAITQPLSFNRGRQPTGPLGNPFYGNRSKHRPWMNPEKIGSPLPPINLLAIEVILILLLPYNIAHWTLTYGIGKDNGYSQIIHFGQEHLPPGEPINASGDAVKFHYFFPNQLVTDAATPTEAQAMSVHYFVLAPKDVRSHYGRIQPELANWILEKGERLFAVYSDSYGDIYLYRVDYPDPILQGARNTTSNGAHWRSYHPAKGGYVGIFLVSLIVWIGIWQAFAEGLAVLEAAYAGSWKPKITQLYRSQRESRLT